MRETGVRSLHRATVFFLFFFYKHWHYWTIERLCWGPLRRRQIKYVDGSDNNPEDIQARNGNEWKAFNRAVGPAAFEVRKKVNGGQCVVWPSVEKKKNKKKKQKTLHSTFFVVEEEAKERHSRLKDANSRM